MDALLHDTPDNPVPERAMVGTFTGTRGCRLRYAIFKTDRTVARGTIVLLHGRNEAIEKYYETIGDLTAAGFWVATFDWRGQGGSERLLGNPRKGHVRRFVDYERDLELFLEHIVLPDTRLPFFLLAHSTGGLIALSAAPRLANRIERMVLSAPFVELGDRALGQKAIKAIATMLCWMGLGRLQIGHPPSRAAFDDNALTSDAVRFQRNAAIVETVPELRLGAPTARWLREALRTIARVGDQRHLGRIRIPTLIVAPTQDPIVSARALEQLDGRFRAGHLCPIDGSRHEVFQERDVFRDRALAAIDAFLPAGNAKEDAA